MVWFHLQDNSLPTTYCTAEFNPGWKTSQMLRVVNNSLKTVWTEVNLGLNHITIMSWHNLPASNKLHFTNSIQDRSLKHGNIMTPFLFLTSSQVSLFFWISSRRPRDNPPHLPPPPNTSDSLIWHIGRRSLNQNVFIILTPMSLGDFIILVAAVYTG